MALGKVGVRTARTVQCRQRKDGDAERRNGHTTMNQSGRKHIIDQVETNQDGETIVVVGVVGWNP